MKTYPEVIELSKYERISDTTIADDITDTEDEIRRLREVQQAERIIAIEHLSEVERRMASFKAEARTGEIADREAFIAFLKRLQAARAAAQLTPGQPPAGPVLDLMAALKASLAETKQ